MNIKNTEKKWYVWCSGEEQFLDDCFNSEADALAAISCYDDEEAYLMKAVQMSESEHKGRWFLNYLYASDDARALDKHIQAQDNKDYLYQQISATTDCTSSTEWIAKLYAEHFKKALLEGGVATEEDFQEINLMPFKNFLNHLRKEIDFVDNYAEALAKHAK